MGNQIDLDGLISKLMGGPATPTQKEFVLSPERRAWFTGPVGSGKTTSLVTSGILPGLMYPGSEWLVARWTYWTLEQTTLKVFLASCKRLGSNIFAREPKVGPPFEIWLNTGPGKEPSHYIFHGLDEITKLGSTQFNGVLVDEVNEIDDVMAGTLDERLRAKLPSQEIPEGPFFLRMSSNPVTRSHWLHKKFCAEEDSDPVPWGKKYNPHPKENAHNLPPGYYETIAQGKSPEMKLRMIEGQCGPDPMGKAVFSGEFHTNLHVANLRYNPNMPMGRSWDFGRRRPCVVWFQRVGNLVNRYLVELGDNESLEKFADRVLMRSRYEFPAAQKWFDVCDPHGERKVDVSDLSSCDVLRKKGIRPMHRYVDVKPGLELMSKGLNTMVQGRPMSQYDKKGCQILIDGYLSGYVWPMNRPGHAPKEKPLADGYYEHPMDCDRYIMVNALMGATNTNPNAPPRVLRKVRSSVTGY